MDPVLQRPARSAAPRRQRGAVAVVVALSALVLFGFAGIAIDVGRLFINRTELQTAADACALAAAAELTCDATTGACPTSFLLNAQAAGIYAAGLNKRDFQVNPVAIAATDVKFYTALAPNANYLSIAGGASPNSRYVMCTASAGGITPWFMGVFGTGAQTVTSAGVATRAPGQSICPTSPIGVCRLPGAPAPNYGYTPNQWIASSFTNAGGGEGLSAGAACDPAVYPGCAPLGGYFTWIDYVGAHSTGAVRDLLNGASSVCDVKVGDTVFVDGQKQGAKDAYNGRFGVYSPGGGPTAPDPHVNPPDRTGYSYPSKAPGPIIDIGNSGAFANYRAKQGVFADFVKAEYDNGAAGGAFNPNPTQPAAGERSTYGQDRRLFAAPFIDCSGGAGSVPPIAGMGCFLMLNPMSNGANGTIFIQYVGLTTAAGSACRTAGFVGGATSTGAQVPTLVQ